MEDWLATDQGRSSACNCEKSTFSGSVCRSNWPCKGPLVTRMRGKSPAAAISALALLEEATLNSVLLCPLQRTTSPIRTLLRLTQPPLEAQAASSKGFVEAMRGGNMTFQNPLAGTAVVFWEGRPVKETDIVSPGVPQPQIGMGLLRCRTWLLPKTFENCNVPNTCGTAIKKIR